MNQLYVYSCTSRTGTSITGTYRYRTNQFDRNELVHHVMGNVCSFVYEKNLPWDPFNIELIVKAQNEPKPYKCKICGSLYKAHLCD